MLKVLIAEDNIMMADLLEETLLKSNYDVCGIASTIAKSVELAKSHKPDVILLDQRLAGHGRGTDVADGLSAFRDIGILYVTGNAANVMETATNGHGCLTKPYRLDELFRSIEIVTEMVATGTASQPFPRGFQVLPSAVGVNAA